MIDIENEVFTNVYDAVIAEYPDALVKGVYTPTPTQFPFVSVIQTENETFVETYDSSGEHDVTVDFQVDVYSRKANGKKAECKAVTAIVNDVMLTMGFARTYSGTVLNLADTDTYRITSRFRCITDGKNIYRRY